MRERGWWFGLEGFDPVFWWGGRSGGRRRRRRQWFESGDMKYVILRLLRDKPMHGYEVMKELEEQCHGCYKPSPGTVYPTLQWLEDEGLVASSEKNGKKVYSVTEEGLKFLEENRSTVEDIFDRVEEMIDHFVGGPMPDLNRAIGRLVRTTYRTAWRQRGDATRQRRIAEIIDSAYEQIRAMTEDGDTDESAA